MNAGVVGLVVLASLLLRPAWAQDEHSNVAERAVVTLPAGAVVDQDYFAYGERVEISGTVNGDVYVAGGQILVDGTVNGDLLAAGGAVTMSGTVSQDARIAGGQIAVNGAIGRNLTVAGGNVEVSDPAVIGRGLVAAGGRVRVAAPVERDAKVAAGSVTVSNAVKGNLHAATGDLRLTSKAAIAGDLTYWSQADASIDRGANVAGVITHKTLPEYRGPKPGALLGALAGFIVLAKLVSLVSTLVLGLLFLYLLPRYTGSTVSILRTRPWASLGIGFIALAVTPAAAGVLLLTVLGAPLALLLMALYLAALYVARVFVIVWAGSAVFAWTGKQVRPVWALVIGVVIYGILTVVPFFGWVIALLVTMFGLGAALLADRALVRTASA
jgi:cytoskeletal protein CcmA (bactofilin family)